MFRVLYHLVPLSIALLLFGGVELWRSVRAKPPPPMSRKLQTGELSFNPIMPATISVRQTMRTGSADSL